MPLNTPHWTFLQQRNLMVCGWDFLPRNRTESVLSMTFLLPTFEHRNNNSVSSNTVEVQQCCEPKQTGHWSPWNWFRLDCEINSYQNFQVCLKGSVHPKNQQCQFFLWLVGLFIRLRSFSCSVLEISSSNLMELDTSKSPKPKQRR